MKDYLSTSKGKFYGKSLYALFQQCSLFFTFFGFSCEEVSPANANSKKKFVLLLFFWLLEHFGMILIRWVGAFLRNGNNEATFELNENPALTIFFPNKQRPELAYPLCVLCS